MYIDVTALSHIGRKKDKNEDSFGVFDDMEPGLRLFRQGMLMAVADGLGGHVGGDIASKLAVSMLKDILKDDPPPEEDIDSEREDTFYRDTIKRAMERANDSIFQTNRDLIKNKRPMGTTLCTVLIRPHYAYVGNVGDSRGYLFRNGQFTAQTEDHSWVDEQVKQGLMSREEANKDSRKNLVTRCIGTHETIEVDLYRWRIEPGDQLLVCTDGLINMVDNTEIASVLNQKATTREKVHQLIDLANKNGGKDNITVILAWLNPDPKTLKTLRMREWVRKQEEKIKKIFVVSVFGLLCFFMGYLVRYFSTR
ncbi:MAG: Serine/threonine phosphatase stp [Candidatus Hydrogenedentes bacterium ADurb.Bin101]|mgnify:FL=1|jgi:protein phosphatase|nr:MAG: Serine/threonine phosphatase stp [Candidatus Hydrogenedentes bacterium ADurb.Bin101]HOC70010.1 Stp1/IreP family PP2C-type Ser/Thr phosphatase [Candidatus Hydrogenedentota bacterium]